MHPLEEIASYYVLHESDKWITILMRFPQVATRADQRRMNTAVKLCILIQMRLLRKKREYTVISVGGSLLVPGAIDTAFIQKFRAVILKKIREGSSFYIVAGGGRLSRNYQDAARDIRGSEELEREDMDWLGIHSTRLNAHLLRTIFIEDAQPRIVKNPHTHISMKHPVIVGAGWKPGWSTDYCAVLAARHLGAKRVINLSNIDHVYTADPRKDPTAQKIEKIGWTEFRNLIPKEWDPGLSAPFDPVASREADEHGIQVAVINGANLQELENYLDDKPFVGTLIG